MTPPSNYTRRSRGLPRAMSGAARSGEVGFGWCEKRVSAVNVWSGTRRRWRRVERGWIQGRLGIVRQKARLQPAGKRLE